MPTKLEKNFLNVKMSSDLPDKKLALVAAAIAQAELAQLMWFCEVACFQPKWPNCEVY